MKPQYRNVIILMTAQAFIGAQMPMLFVIGGLAGQALVNNLCWATLPISLIVFGSMTAAPWIGRIMQTYGRKVGFLIGTASGALGAGLAAYGLSINSFALLLAGSYCAGIYMSTQGFYRFAATDCASDDFRPKAISYVMVGGLVAAVLGPQLSKLTIDAFVTPFVGVYIAIFFINIIGFGLFCCVDISCSTQSKDTNITPAKQNRGYLQLLQTPEIAVAIICVTISYALMNLVMTSTPLAVIGCGFGHGNAADVVMVHVLGMFLPSFFTGHLIVRFGVERIIALGFIILSISGLINLAGYQLVNFFGGLLLLGIGWNFSFIGATTLLSSSHNATEAGRAQGMNDFFMFGIVTLASLSSGFLMNCSGNSPQQGWNAVNFAMVPFLLLAGGALFWLSQRRKRTAVR